MAIIISSKSTKSPAEFIKDPIDDQIEWYDKNSGYNQRRYKIFQIIKITFALAIPLLTLIMDWPPAKYIVGVLGALIVFIEGFVRIYNYQELWIKYRMASETLKHHKNLYMTRTIPYNHEDAFTLFVKNTHDIMNAENVGWYEVSNRDDD
jgi:hypothetical protein